MEAIDELISAAQTFYDDARANENGRSRSWEHCYRGRCQWVVAMSSLNASVGVR